MTQDNTWRDTWGKLWGKGWGASLPSPGEPPSRNPQVFSYSEAVWTLSFWVFKVTSLQNPARPVHSDSSSPLCAEFHPPSYGAGHLWNEKDLLTYYQTKACHRIYGQLDDDRKARLELLWLPWGRESLISVTYFGGVIWTRNYNGKSKYVYHNIIKNKHFQFG
jgi:hypothetical protein